MKAWVQFRGIPTSVQRAWVLAMIAAAATHAGWVESAREAMRDGLYDMAERWLKLAWSNAPSAAARFECALALVEARLRAGHAREALQRWTEEAPAEFREDPRAAVAMARIYLRMGDPQLALAALTNVELERLDLSQREFALRALADALWELHLTDESCAVIESLLDSPLGPAALVRHGLVAAQRRSKSGDRPGAVTLLESLLHRVPQLPESALVRIQLGAWYIEGGRVAEIPRLVGPVTAQAVPPLPRAAAYLLVAAAHAASRNSTEALHATATAVDVARGTPAEVDAILARASLCVQEEQLDEAQELLRRVFELVPRHPRATELALAIGRRWLDRNRLAEALRTFEWVLEVAQEPAHQAEAWFGRAWCLLELGRAVEAAPLFEQAAEKLPDARRRIEAAIKAADAWAAARQYTTAADRYHALRGRVGTNELHRVIYLEGDARARGGQTDVALAVLSELENAPEPWRSAARVRRGQVHEQRQEWDAARAWYDRVIADAPATADASRARLLRGLLHYRHADFEPALADFDAVVRRGDGPEFQQASAMRVWCLFMLQRTPEAIAAAQEFLSRHEGSALAMDLRFWLAEQALQCGDWAEAEEKFRELAERAPTSPLAPLALYRAGRVAAARGEHLRAIEYFRRVVTDHPTSPIATDARFAQADSLTELARFDSALLAFDEVIQRTPDSYLAALAWGRKGDCHFTLAPKATHRYDEAVACYQTAADHPRATPDLKLQAWYKMGRCYELSGRLDLALERYLATVYGHVEERAAARAGAPVWFARAALSAAALYERREQWREAARIYRRVIDDGGPAAADAQALLRQLQTRHWDAF